MNIVYMGNSGFAAPSLKKLNQEFNIQAVYTKPARRCGRGMNLKKGKIEKLANKFGIDIRTPHKFDEKEKNYLEKLNPDLIVVVCYGLKIPKYILDIPAYFTINAHASLLPEYRGASPINKVILEGEEKSGITVFKLNEKWDAGDIINKYEIDIEEDETAESLWEKLRHLAADALINSINNIKRGSYSLTPQDDSRATYAHKIRKKDAKIDWNKSVERIERMVRAYYSWPIAYTYLNGKRLKVYKVEIEKKDTNKENGKVVEINRDRGIGVSAEDGIVYLKEIQPAGKRKMNFQDFINGYDIKEGQKFE
ncbi:MAG: methionyl-tRNA formyltransferase [Candidatus Mcinerneyibacterium aminivorans]|uniref:Methionyl-tRNA formyltransferase n=1 Tax=Candidatus Mcinerneyibacterium aminivorans TaxID=2703815 RepID=A0A5D0MIB8_9BACT|nr:MAG: methionyl-tRNA formyltransferase [Candidatus Mcinerneyibacterium aminivorans]